MIKETDEAENRTSIHIITAANSCVKPLPGETESSVHSHIRHKTDKKITGDEDEGWDSAGADTPEVHLLHQRSTDMEQSSNFFAPS